MRTKLGRRRACWRAGVRIQRARRRRAVALAKLYKSHPEARKAVEGAAGYGVFDISAIYAVLFVGQTGKGVLFNNATKKPTYMNATRAGTGPGLGRQRVYQVFVFKTRGAMEQFMLAKGAGGDVSVSARGLKEARHNLLDLFHGDSRK